MSTAAPAPAAPATPVVSLPAAAPAKLPPIADMKAAVLAAPADEIRRVGRHLIVGYHHAGQLTPLLELGAIGGVFVTARNARGRTKDKITAEIATFRDLAAKAGQQPFWISTGQEGGGVSRLSPPLPYQPSLARLVRDLATAEARDAAVTDFADRQAEALAGIGVNLNFAPVADLNLDARNARATPPLPRMPTARRTRSPPSASTSTSHPWPISTSMPATRATSSRGCAIARCRPIPASSRKWREPIAAASSSAPFPAR